MGGIQSSSLAALWELKSSVSPSGAWRREGGGDQGGGCVQVLWAYNLLTVPGCWRRGCAHMRMLMQVYMDVCCDY